jgi:hypothetical protein
MPTWIRRIENSSTMDAGYGETIVNVSTITHTVRYAGAFGPGMILAKEYDSIVTRLSF